MIDLLYRFMIDLFIALLKEREIETSRDWNSYDCNKKIETGILIRILIDSYFICWFIWNLPSIGFWWTAFRSYSPAERADVGMELEIGIRLTTGGLKASLHMVIIREIYESWEVKWGWGVPTASDMW